MLITSNGQLVANGTLAQTKYSLTHHILFVRILLCKGLINKFLSRLWCDSGPVFKKYPEDLRVNLYVSRCIERCYQWLPVKYRWIWIYIYIYISIYIYRWIWIYIYLLDIVEMFWCMKPIYIGELLPVQYIYYVPSYARCMIIT
jgi:hypothetical protein